MSENKITTNRIEEVLLKKKLSEYALEVERAAGKLADLLNLYKVIDTDKEAFEQYKEWVSGIIFCTWQTFVSSEIKIKSKMPDAVKANILKVAVDEFIHSIESTKEIVDSLGE